MRQHSGKKRLGAVLLSLALCLGLLPTAALAVGDSVEYLAYNEKDGTFTSATKNDGEYIVISESSAPTTWGETGQTKWYVAQDKVTISSRVTVTGDVRLILADGCTLTVNGGINVAEGNSLTIYGQTAGTGTLVAKANTTGCAGIGGGSLSDGGTVTIYGGTVNASSGGNGAGIGGGVQGDGGTVCIYGGTVTATSGNGAGIGGGVQGAGGTITISGGTVTATGGRTGGAGIGGGLAGDPGTFSTGNNGRAVIFASSIQANNPNGWSGVIFQGDSGQVYGSSITPTEDFTIPAGYTLTIPQGTTLTIPQGVTLTNKGSITVGEGGTLTNSGTILLDGGTIEGSVTGSQPCYPTSVDVNVSPSPTWGGTVTLTATVTGGSDTINSGTVTFYRGDAETGTALNNGGASVNNGTATHTIDKLDWTPGSYTITAKYSGVTSTSSGSIGLAESSKTFTLTVNKAAQDTAPGAPSGASAVTATSITLNAVTGSGQGGVEYGYTTESGSARDILNWQTDTTFSNLNANTAYTFYARYAGNENYEPSDPSSTGTTIYTAYAAPATGEGYTIDYAAETVTAWDGYEVWLADSNTWGTGPINITPGDTFQVRHTGTQGGAPASASVAISIPARPDAPAVTGGVERIQGATTDMEYRTGDGAWTRFTQATVGHLDPGTYAVRLAATASAFASDPVTVEVTQYTPPANPNYRIDVTTTEGGTVDKDPAAAKAGETVTLTPTPDAGYEVADVTVTDRFGDAVEVTENADGTYTFTMPNGQVRVEVTFVEAAPEPLPFTDVNEGDWFHDAVQYAYENGLMDGVGDGQFAPNATTNRAMVVTILYRLAGEPAVSGDVGFADVAVGQWYTDAVAWAAQKGIVNGISETEFAPSGDLTREQLATILYRYAESMGYDVSAQADLSGFPDAGDIQSYATQALSWAVAEGLLQGFEDDSLRPGGTATRAQIATILMRFCEGVAE